MPEMMKYYHPIAAESSDARANYNVLDVYSIVHLLDVLIVLGYGCLGVCYAIARYYKHVGTFCDISDLGAHLPESILFRIDFSLLGSIIFLLSWVPSLTQLAVADFAL